MMKIKTLNLKTALGIVFILLAVAALFFWEAEGREILLMEEVLTADKDIYAGEAIDPSMFHTVSIPTGTLVHDAISPHDADIIYGKEATVEILQGSQLSIRHLKDPAAKPKPETSYFIIRNEWISMCTSSLRRGDEVLITSADGKTIIGRYPVVYVKDSDGREVTDTTSGIYSLTGDAGENERVNTSAPIHHIEIECELEDYRNIIAYCESKAGAPLMLVRKEKRHDGSY